ALALLRQSYDAQTLSEAWMLNGRLVDIGTGRDVLHADPAQIDSLDIVALEIALSEDDTLDRWRVAYDAEADVLSILEGPAVPSVSGLFDSGFQYLKADRIVPEVTYPKSHEAVTVLRTLGPSGEHAPNYLRVYGEAPIPGIATRHPSAVTNSLLDQ